MHSKFKFTNSTNSLDINHLKADELTAIVPRNLGFLMKGLVNSINTLDYLIQFICSPT